MIYGIWKPKGITSHDAINILRKKTGEKRIGHAGTLDPMAEGILVVGIGRESTKKLAEVVAKEKEYLAEITLGSVSDTDDAEGVVESYSKKIPDKKTVEKIFNRFVGHIKQIPPAYSAIKIKGERSYKLARSGEKVNLKPREILIKKIKLKKYKYPVLVIKVTTGPGVYIRALARDIGKALGTGAHLSALIRTRVGEFSEKTAEKITDFQ